MNKYKYSSSVKIENKPIHYNYSEFHGKSFIEDYFKKRFQFEMFLKKKHNTYANFKKKEINIDKSYQNGFNSENFLEIIFFNLLESRKISSNLSNLINILIGKFEISKRIRYKYGKKCSKITSKNASIDAHCFFAGIIAGHLQLKFDLRLLNTLLKINDLISSNKKKIKSTKAFISSNYAIETELNFINKLTKKLKININEFDDK